MLENDNSNGTWWAQTINGLAVPCRSFSVHARSVAAYDFVPGVLRYFPPDYLEQRNIRMLLLNDGSQYHSEKFLKACQDRLHPFYLRVEV